MDFINRLFRSWARRSSDKGSTEQTYQDITSVPADLLDQVRFIARVKDELGLPRSGFLNSYGVFVRTGRNAESTIPVTGQLYMCGGVHVPRLTFVDSDEGKTVVVKYKAGQWEDGLQRTFEKAGLVSNALSTDDAQALDNALFLDEVPGVMFGPAHVDYDKVDVGL